MVARVIAPPILLLGAAMALRGSSPYLRFRSARNADDALAERQRFTTGSATLASSSPGPWLLSAPGPSAFSGNTVAGVFIKPRVGSMGASVPLATVLVGSTAVSSDALSEHLGDSLDPGATFKCDVSDFTSERALKTHSGGCGDPPEVEILNSGEDGIYAARGTLRVPVNAMELFLHVTDPYENQRIFSNNKSTTVTLNYRTLLNEDEKLGTRLFEVSKTGRWRIFGIPFSFESSVYALEDWKNLEIRHCLKSTGAMRHMSGFWRFVPIGPQETLVLFHNEGQPVIPLPWPLRPIGGRTAASMLYDLMEDIRLEASHYWDPEWTASEAPKWVDAAAAVH